MDKVRKEAKIRRIDRARNHIANAIHEAQGEEGLTIRDVLLILAECLRTWAICAHGEQENQT